MRKLLAGIVVAVSLFALTSCGGPSLTKQESQAVVAVEQNINSLAGSQSYGNEQVVGQVAKDADGNKVTFVYLTVTDPSNNQKWSLLVIVVENTKGQLVFADADIPSGVVTVIGPGAK